MSFLEHDLIRNRCTLFGIMLWAVVPDIIAGAGADASGTLLSSGGIPRHA
jgi:hypothetical protein